MISRIENYLTIENDLTIETQTEDNDRRPSLAELQAEDRVSILSFKKIHICLYVILVKKMVMVLVVDVYLSSSLYNI